MAISTSFPVKYKCGHTEKRDLSNVAASKRRQLAESDFFATKAGSDDDGMVCDKCFKENQKVDKEAFIRQLMLDTEAFENQHELPEMTGTEKQVTSGLVESARRDRFTVLEAILESDEFAEQGDAALSAARTLTWGGWWTNHLGYKERRIDNDYGPEEYLELIIDGADQEAKRESTNRIEAENPHDWKPAE